VTFAGNMIGLALCFFLFFPKLFAQHCAVFTRAYRAAMTEPGPDKQPPR